MINWQDEGIIIRHRTHGESSAILDIFTPQHGRYSGVVRGGASRKNAPLLQPGQLVIADYSARLESHLGSFRIESKRSYLGRLMAEPRHLDVFNAMAAMVRFGMEERDPHPRLYTSFLHALETEENLAAYVQFEIALLEEAGFALSLSECAVSGATTGLAFVSPKTGRAVTREAAGEWADQLLPYSPVFSGKEARPKDTALALQTTGYFLTHWLGQMVGQAELPAARQRLLNRLEAD